MESEGGGTLKETLRVVAHGSSVWLQASGCTRCAQTHMCWRSAKMVQLGENCGCSLSGEILIKYVAVRSMNHLIVRNNLLFI
mgnify:CR=1 FL=1